MDDYNKDKELERQDTIYKRNEEQKVVNFTKGMVVFVDFNNARFAPFKGLVFE